MPELDGYDATRQIRQVNSNVVIIAQTALASNRDIEIALASGCNDHIVHIPVIPVHVFR
jgi:CheY-like chemotaxis protein